ncbi:interferon alpha-inducible protein 27-like protein 1 isoform X6 [Gorilla gorilla gorilla]|uniref:interferon alpha-inducible protein 27-like protein 1 isoform X6 n=1 Tax=Gorilla gorilla gorilla TaxID=9595 RepID=UPI0030088BBD
MAHCSCYRIEVPIHILREGSWISCKKEFQILNKVKTQPTGGSPRIRVEAHQGEGAKHGKGEWMGLSCGCGDCARGAQCHGLHLSRNRRILHSSEDDVYSSHCQRGRSCRGQSGGYSAVSGGS